VSKNDFTVVVAGDVCGESGLLAAEKFLPGIKAACNAGLTIVNGENAADGFGITAAASERIFAAGADVITSGNHIWEKREFSGILNGDARVLRPANYPPSCPGRGWLEIEKDGGRFIVINLQGREFMPLTDCPFRTFDAIYEQCLSRPAPRPDGTPADGGQRKPVFIVDFHGESAREKEALAFYLDGRAALVTGTHTHIQTADERILPLGTGYITDIGISGAENGIIGMDKELCLRRAKTQIPHRMQCASGQPFVQCVIAGLDTAAARCVYIERRTVSLSRPCAPPRRTVPRT